MKIPPRQKLIQSQQSGIFSLTHSISRFLHEHVMARPLSSILFIFGLVKLHHMTSNHWSALRWAILLPFALGLAAEGLAQDHCWIKYSYDAAGNRISRKWWCGDPTKVEEEEESKSRRVEDFGFRLMPVPARSELTLTSQHDLAGAELEVFTLQGRSVLIQRASGSSAVLDVAALSAGIYVLHIRNGLSEYVTQFNVVH